MPSIPKPGSDTPAAASSGGGPGAAVAGHGATAPARRGPAPAPAAADWVDHHLRVRYAETDAQGVVYHANYLVFMEVGRGALARERGLPYSELEARGVNLLVSRAELKYRASARYDDRLVVRTRVREIRGKLVTFEYRIEHEESGRLLVTGETAHVCANDVFRPVDVPDWVRVALTGGAAAPSGEDAGPVDNADAPAGHSGTNGAAGGRRDAEAVS
jgi:acyl-CoA thioester hydrolase